MTYERKPHLVKKCAHILFNLIDEGFVETFLCFVHVKILADQLDQVHAEFKRIFFFILKYNLVDSNNRHTSSNNKKSKLYFTRGITPKSVTSGRDHLHGSASGQHSSKKTSQRWRAVGDTVSSLRTRALP